MITVIKADITTLDVDAIVNAANSSLSDGAGVNGAIQRAAGPSVLEECQQWVRRNGECHPGGSVLTKAGKLRARFIIHSVGPIWTGGSENEDEILGSAYRSALTIASTHKLKRIAFPNISTGIYGFPKERAARVAIQTVEAFLSSGTSIRDLIFCCYDKENHSIYTKLLS